MSTTVGDTSCSLKHVKSSFLKVFGSVGMEGREGMEGGQLEGGDVRAECVSVRVVEVFRRWSASPMPGSCHPTQHRRSHARVCEISTSAHRSCSIM